MKISKIAENIKPSMTVGISDTVNNLKKEGKKIINLSIGEPDFFTPEIIKDNAKNAIDNNITKYTAAAGDIELRNEICKKLKKENNVEYKAENIVVNSGAKMSITLSILSTLNKDDEVLIPKPYWLSYPKTVEILGSKPVFIETKKENNFKVTIDDIKNNITEKTSMFILNNPSNPTGSVYTKEELLELCEYLTEKNIIILADEIYERLTYDFDFVSVPSLSEKIKNNTILINGHSKSFSMTGWRIGYIAAPKEIAKKMTAIQSHIISHPSTISMKAALAALKYAENDVIKMKNEYKKRRDIIIKMAEKYNINIIKPQGAFYIFIEISKFKNKIKSESLSLKLCEILLEEKQIALTPGIVFGNDDYIRLSYAANIDEIKQAMQILGEFFNENN